MKQSFRFIKKQYLWIFICLAVCLNGYFIYNYFQKKHPHEYQKSIVVGLVNEVEAKGFDPVSFGLPETAKEVVTERTDRTATFSLSPGKFAQVSTDASLLVRDTSGKLVPVSEKGIINKRAFVFDKLPLRAKISFNLDKPEYTFTQDNYWMKIAFNGNAPGFVIADNKIQYRLADHIFLYWTVTGANVLKAIKIEQPGILPDTSFSLTYSSNLKMVKKEKILYLLNPAGDIIFHTQEPYLLSDKGERLPQPVELVQDGNRFSYVYDQKNLPYPYIIDPSLGANAPGTLADDATVGGQTWTNPTNAASTNASYATVSLLAGGVSHYLKGTNFSFSVPSGATINGIVGTVVMKCSLSSSCYDNSVKLVKTGTIQGNSNARSSSTFWPTTDTTVTYGSSSDLWGLAFTTANVNASDFGLVFSGARP